MINHLSFFCIMRARFCRFHVVFLLILSLVGVSSRQFAPNYGFAVKDQGIVHNPQSLQTTWSSNQDSKNKSFQVVEEAAKHKETNKIGSSPPSCENKCYGCMPCEPIQVPTTSGSVGVQYTNYEPEGWKCKCGPTFYSP